MYFGIYLDRFDRPLVSIESLGIVSGLFTIVRIELEAIQAIVIVPIVWVVSIASVVFPYDRLDRLVLF